MKISVFLSYPKPYKKNQEIFLDELCNYLQKRGIEPRTLGVTDYDMDAPLAGIRRIMLESNGILTVAFRRTYIQKGIIKPGNEYGADEKKVDGMWLTSPFSHIEPAMAFQLGLPVLIFREQGVIDDGILEKGVLGTYMPEFNLDTSVNSYFKSDEFCQLIGQWEGKVHQYVENKGYPRGFF